MFKFLNFKKQKKNGFSLLEVLVAITVLTVGLVGVVGLINYNISISRTSPEKIIAVNLAQEGIEVVRNIRDSNWLAGNAFDTDIEGDKVYVLEVSNANGLPSDGYKLRDGGVNNIDIDKYQVLYDTVDGFYAQKAPPGLRPDDWERPASDIHRLIEITEIDIDGINYYLAVKSNVKWYDRSGNSHTVTLEDHLYDWAQ